MAGWDNPQVRVAVAVLAVVVIGWLAVMERDARLYDRAIATGGKLDNPATIERAESDLRGARWLSPDRTPDLSRAFILANLGRRAEALALAQDVVRAEPDSLEAWDALRYVNDGKDPALARRAEAEVARLDPLSQRGR